MRSDNSSDVWGERSDPFREPFYLLPHEEEIQARAQQISQDNRNAIRHFVEMLVWEAREDTELLRIVVSLLWHWEDIDPSWLAESCFMTVGDVRNLAESQTLMVFHCLDCGTQIEARNRHHRIRMHRSVEEISASGASAPPEHLLCEVCTRQRSDHEEQQRLLDHSRQQALLSTYRKRPYAERRKTTEWAVLKNRIHRRDQYRCRLCGTQERQLHVHHCTYDSYGTENLEDLITLCNVCHQNFHSLSKAS